MIEQLAILFTGVAAIWLSQDKLETRRKFAPVLGLLSQPFWFYSAYKAEQWGIVAMCFLYSWAWAKGIKTYWAK